MVKNQAYLDIPPWQSENSGQRFGGPCCIQLRGPIKPWFGGDKLLCNVGNCLPSDLVLYFRKLAYSFLLIFLTMKREIIIQACKRCIAYL